MKHFAKAVFLAALIVLPPGLPAFATEIRTAAQNSQPKFIQNGSAVEGLCVDVFRAIERLDPTVKFSPLESFVPLTRIEYMMVEGHYDAFCGLAKTSTRQARFDFIEIPLYQTHSMLAARIDDQADIKSFDDLQALGRDALVLVVAKTVHAAVLADQTGVQFVEGGRNLTDTLNMLIRGRGRFVFHSDIALKDEIKRYKLEDKIKLLPTQFATEGRYLVVSKKAAPEVKEKLGIAMEKLRTSGELSKIVQSYRTR